MIIFETVEDSQILLSAAAFNLSHCVLCEIYEKNSASPKSIVKKKGVFSSILDDREYYFHITENIFYR